MTNYFITCLLALGMIMGMNHIADKSGQDQTSLRDAVTCIVAAPICIGAVVGMAAASNYSTSENK